MHLKRAPNLCLQALAPSECTGVYINPAPWSLDLNRLCCVSPSFHSSGLLTGRREYVSVRNRALFWPSGVERTKSSGEASRVAGGEGWMVALQLGHSGRFDFPFLLVSQHMKTYNGIIERIISPEIIMLAVWTNSFGIP